VVWYLVKHSEKFIFTSPLDRRLGGLQSGLDAVTKRKKVLDPAGTRTLTIQPDV
jgi:hypothetical protein